MRKIFVEERIEDIRKTVNDKIKNFKRLKINDIITLKYRRYKTFNNHLTVEKGRIIHADGKQIIVQDLEKSYKRFTVEVNSFIANDVIIKIEENKYEEIWCNNHWW